MASISSRVVLENLAFLLDSQGGCLLFFFFFFLIESGHINQLTNTTQVYLIIMHREAMHSSILGR